MEYFILEINTAYIPPRLMRWYGKLDPIALENREHYHISKHMFFNVEEHMQMVFTDIIMHPRFMVSKEAMKVIQLYEPLLPFVKIILFDRAKKDSRAYYIPFLEEADALTEGCHFNLNRSVIHHAQVDGSKIGDKALVRVSNVNQVDCILIRLDLAESLLSRKMLGIGLRETDTVYFEERS